MSDDIPSAASRPFCVIDAQGRVVMRGHSLDLPELPGHTTLAEEAPADHYRDDGVWTAMPTRPSERHTFDWSAKTWHDPRTLADSKAARWSEIKRQRDLLEASGFPYMGKAIDSDPRSVQRINTVVQAAQAAIGVGQAFTIVWTCADNTLLMLDAAAVLGMPVALALYADALHQTCKTLRTQIAASTTVAEVEAITWPPMNSPETDE
jgi:hypothetical protein